MERPKGVVARLKRTGKGRRVIRKKERKDVLDLQKRVETLIDLTTAVIRPKLLGKHDSGQIDSWDEGTRATVRFQLECSAFRDQIPFCGQIS